MKKTKIIALIVALIVLLFAFSMTASAETLDGWVSNPDGTYSYYEYGTLVTDQEIWDGESDTYYRVDENGIMYSDRWYESSWGDWYYYDTDGSRVEGKFKFIGGKWYYFGYSGDMYANTNFGLYDDNLEKTVYYRAKEDGTLYTDEWYEDEEGNWYYYDENCQAKQGFKYLDGEWYYFDYDACLYVDGTFDVYDGTLERWVYYRAKEDGTLYTDEWYVDEDGNWYYYDENCQAPSGSAYVDGAWYYFFSDGQMADEENSYSYYDNSLDRWVYYRTKEDGTLYVNEWYCDDYGDWYYYGEAGKSASGFVQVGNTSYYFYDVGRMATNTSVESNGRFFIINEDGFATECANNGWSTLDGEWYYVQDGAFCRNNVYLIAGSYYGFDYRGRMYVDTRFNIYYYDETTESSNRYYYHALSDGTLAVNQWVEDGSNWYYYGYGGVGPTGPVYVSGLLYYFSDGRMLTNTTMVYGDRFIVAGKDGVCVEGTNNSWIYCDDNYYYVKDNEFCYGKIVWLDNAGYAFDRNGRLYKEEAIRTDDDGSQYLIGNDGAVVSAPGWHQHSGSYVYVTTSWNLAEGWTLLEGNWYYFNPSMLHSTIFSDYADDGKIYLYAFDENGLSTSITADGWIQLGGYWYYIQNNSLLTESWMSLNGDYYYFDSWGDMVRNSSYYIDGYYYYFDTNGRMCDYGWVRSTGGAWSYANPDGTLTTGIDAQGYVFDSSGALRVDAVTFIDGYWRVTDNAGKLVATLAQGWNNIAGDWYYVDEENEIANYTYYIDDYRYYFENYKMVTNRHIGSYYYGADGYALTGWINLGGDWYYGNPNDYGCLFDYGIYYIDGTEYYFSDYILQANTTQIYSDRLISTDANGVVVSETDAEGWIYNNNNGYGSLYYFEDGEAYHGWYGNYYLNYGRLAANAVIWDDEYCYYIDKNGLCVYNTWIEHYDSYYFAKADGTLCYDEWYNANGVWYYFDGCHMVSDSAYNIDGTYNIFDENGVWQGALPTNSTDGWVYENGNYYYYMAGERVGGTIYSNGNWYSVSIVDGMIKNRFSGSYYYGANGARMAYVGWVLIDGNWCYFNESNQYVYGWVCSGGQYYYQDETYDYETETYKNGVVTGYKIINKVVYYFDANGVCINTYTADGWIQVDEDWYYIQNGKVVTGRSMYLISGAYYAFDYEGAMICNTTYNNRLYGADGKMITATGWYLFDGDWYYVIDGYAANGIHLIDGVQYCFSGYVLQ